MSYEEKGTWVYLVVSLGAYGVYLALVLGQAASMPLTEVAYVAPLLWSIGISIAASIVGRILVEIVRPSETQKGDERDRGISRRGLLAGSWFVVAGALAALVMALAEWDTFWIANVIYLSFVLSAVLESIVKLVAYRRGYRAW